MWHRRVRAKVDVAVSVSVDDDSEFRLAEARRRKEESVEILKRTTRRGEAVQRHVKQEQDFRRRNGFVATILDGLQVKP